MSSSVMIWIAWAVVLFWAIGAYNRLVRLRSQVIAAFAALDDQFRHYVALVRLGIPAPADDSLAVRAGLVAAAQQFDSSLRAVRAHPLDALTMRALETAHAALDTAWQRMRDAPPDLAGSPLPETLQQQWDHITMMANMAKDEFNRHVQTYNQAIVQFPARLLASLFSFKPAQLI